MEWYELTVEVTCPHCDYEYGEHVEFNMGEADRSGVLSHLSESQCQECDKTFWFKAYCSFEVELASTYRKKPKGIK